MGKVTLFGGIVGPMGDQFDNPRRPYSYHKTVHGLASGAGFMPFLAGTEVADPAAASIIFPWEWGTPVEWQDANGIPFILVLAGGIYGSSFCNIISSAGAISNDETFTSSKSIAASAAGISSALHSDGSTIPYFFAGFGSSGDAEYRNAAGTWAAMAGTPKQLAGFFSENGNLWGVLPNNYQVRKWPAGTNPVSGTAGSALDVGTSAYPITGAGSLGRSYVVFIKSDGIYIYDIDTNRFENIWMGLASNPHPETGKGTYTWGADIYVPLGWGGMVRVTPSLDVIPVSVLPVTARPGHNTPGLGQVRGMVGTASHLYVAVQPFQQRIKDMGLKVLGTTDDAAFTDRTANLIDEDVNTTYAPGGNPDIAIYVGCTSRFGGFWADILATTNSASGMELDYWNGSAWVSIAFDDTMHLMRTGTVIPTSIVPSAWALTTFGGFSRYWLRYKKTSSFFVNTIRELRALPEGAYPAQGVNIAPWQQDEAGLRTHILRGYPTPEGFFWEDMASWFGDVSLGLIFTRIKAQGGGRTLIAKGPIKHVRFHMGARASPDQLPYANCVNGFATTLHFSAKSLIDDRPTDAPTVRKRITGIDLMVRDFSDGVDIAQAWFRFDKGTWQHAGTSRTAQGTGKITFSVPRQDTALGYIYEVVVGIEDTVQDEFVPKITHVESTIEPIAEQARP